MGVKTKAKKSKRQPKNNNLLLEDLMQLESYVRAFWEFLPIPICYVNPAFNIIDAGKKFEQFSGFEASELIGQGLERFFLDPQEVREIEKKTKEEEAIFKKETVFLTKGDREVPVSISVAPRKDEKNNVIGYFFAFLDITERKKFEQELKERIEALERFQRIAVGRELKMVELKEALQRAKEQTNKQKVEKNKISNK